MSISESVSAGQLRAFIERIERLELEKQTIADDIKEVKAEAKGSGFSVAVINEILKLRKKDPSERAEAEALLDIYKAALGMLPLEEYADREAAGQSYAEMKGVKITPSSGDVFADLGVERPAHLPAHNPETGEIITQEQPSSQDAEVVNPPSTAQPEPAESMGDEISAPIPYSPAVLPGKADKTSEAVAPPSVSLVAIPDSDVPAFLRKDAPVDVTSPEFIKLLRPFCQNLDDCHGHGRECSKCKAARAA